MTKMPEELLALKIGTDTVADNLQRAVAAGRVIENQDRTIELPQSKQDFNWIFVNNGPPLGCDFLMHFMFRNAYGEAAVPHGCSGCYKVKVATRTLRQLVAGWEIAKRIQCRSKWGTDLNNPYSQNIYAGYFYVSGLDAARALFKLVRETFDADSRLGADIAITIKRGCSEYEAALGPSDRYAFTPEQAALEASLKARFRERKSDRQPSMVVAQWIETAFRTGDDTYLDFTGGKRLREKTMTYEPVGHAQ